MKFILILLFSFSSYAQLPGLDDDDELNVGSDIFTDFNEDLEAAQVMEDERFYRYSRFVSMNIGLGYTSFTGNRGDAYYDQLPSFGIGLMYFLDFQNVFTMGFEYSKHTMFIDTYVNAYDSELVGAVDVSMLRPYFGFRYYLDTSDLGTAITYANPYFAGRLEYWYQTNTFRDLKDKSDISGGGLGVGLGGGLEFPIELKKTYFNVEFLIHAVNFYDKYTRDYKQIPRSRVPSGAPANLKLYGWDDLTGLAYSVFFHYVISW